MLPDFISITLTQMCCAINHAHFRRLPERLQQALQLQPPSSRCGLNRPKPIAYVLSYEAAEALHGLSDTLLVAADNLAKVFRVHAGRKGR